MQQLKTFNLVKHSEERTCFDKIIRRRLHDHKVKKLNNFGHFSEAVIELSCAKYLLYIRLNRCKRINFLSKIRPDAERILDAKTCIYHSVLNMAFNS